MRGNDKQWTVKDRIVSSTVNCQPPKYQWEREKEKIQTSVVVYTCFSTWEADAEGSLEVQVQVALYSKL